MISFLYPGLVNIIKQQYITFAEVKDGVMRVLYFDPVYTPVRRETGV